MNLTTVTSRAAAALVAAVAGYASYNHIVDVATGAGEHRGVAMVLPLSIDGLIVVGTMAMLEDKRAGRVPRPMARVALGFGIVATIAANVASAQPTVTARMVAAVPALAFLIAVEVLARSGKPRAALSAPEPSDVAPLTPAAVERWRAERDATEPAPVEQVPPQADATPPAKPRTSRPRARSLTSAQKVARAAAKLPGATVAQIAAKAGVSETTARRYLPPPTEAAPAETAVNGTPVLEPADA